MKPRAFTEQEVITHFLDTVRATARYWAELPDKTPQERCDGVAFSILNIIDGTNMGHPAMDLCLSPHPDDKAYCIANDMNWFEPGQCINGYDMLHELYYPQ